MEFQSTARGVTSLKKHMLRTFTWMFIGVLVTFAVAFLVGTNETLMFEVINKFPFMPIILLVAQLGVVIALGARLMKMSETSAKVLFMVYAVLTGITFSVLAFAYAIGTIAMAFALTCIFFASLVVIGATTKADLSKIGTICYAGLVAMIIFSVIGFFFNISMDSYVFSIIGLVLFMGITAWDTQKMKLLYNANQGDEVMLSKLGIYSALQLYLDFINIFLYILRLLGSKD